MSACHRWRLLLLIPLLLASGPLTPPTRAQPSCSFIHGFAQLQRLIPEIVGTCLENESYNPTTGTSQQRTTGGLLVWRKADNWTAFTDGTTTWILGPEGLVSRPNTDPPFPWEVAAPPPDAPRPTPTPPPARLDLRRLGLMADDLRGSFIVDEPASSYGERSDGSTRAVVTLLPQRGQVGDPPQFFSVVDRYPDATTAEAGLRAVRPTAFFMGDLQLFEEPARWEEVDAPLIGEASRAFQARRTVILYQGPDGTASSAAMSAGWLWTRRANFVYGIGMAGLETLVSLDTLLPHARVVDGRVREAVRDQAGVKPIVTVRAEVLTRTQP